ncbi:MAG: hypothetical protein AAFR59_06210, partial [Bacteroidota bacterium]
MVNHLLLLGVAGAILCLIWGCQAVSSQYPTQSSAQQVTRTDLIQQFRENPNMNLVYEADAPYAEEMRDHLQALADRARWLNLRVVADTALADSAWENDANYLIGDFKTHRQLRLLSGQLPFQMEASGFSYLDHTYTDPQSTLLMTFLPHPIFEGKLVSILTGNRSEAIWEKLQVANQSSWSHPLFSQWGYEIARGSVRLRLGQFTDDWQLDPEQQWNFEDGDATATSSRHFQLIPHDKKWDIQVLEDFSLNLERNYQRIVSFLEYDPAVEPLKYHLYANAESIGLRTRNMEQAFVRGQAVHEILHPIYLGKPSEAAQALVLEQVLGRPQTDRLLEGLAITLTPRWQGKGYKHWAKCLYRAEVILDPQELLDKDLMDKSSYLIRKVWSAMWVEFLIEEMGKARFLETYATYEPGKAARAQQQSAWRLWLSRQFDSEVEASPMKTPSLPYLAGMTLAHEGYNIVDGYGSFNAQKAVKELEEIGVNTLAIVPYSGSRAIRSPEPYRVWQGAGSENDVSVVFAKYYAWEHGMTALLKPQIYFPGAWPGAVDMQTEEDWDAFFKYYRRWIMHYALLAGIHDFEHFCMGVEFTHATLKHPEAWRKMAQDMRHMYKGYLTYAANWGEESEKIAFADALDYLGVNCYYPLSEKDQPTDAELEAGIQSIMVKMSQ